MSTEEQREQRVIQIQKDREKAQREFEARKNALEQETANSTIIAIKDKFASKSQQGEDEFHRGTTGLVTIEQYKRKRQLADTYEDEAEKAKRAKIEEEERRRRKRQKTSKSTLSFNLEEEADSPTPEVSIRIKKNPDIDTSFLPDREREIQQSELREKLAKEWLAEQEKIKSFNLYLQNVTVIEQEIEVTYSYWDGSGHRRNTVVTKGTTIAQFLDSIRTEFKEIRNRYPFYQADDFSFYDLIESKARGKSGPLFHFDAHEDVRLVVDPNVEKDESHAAKVVERRWYELNKHIFPASRWEVYDPSAPRDK